MIGQWLGQVVGQWFGALGEPVEPPVVPQVPVSQPATGGWGAYNDAQVERRRRKRKRELEELEAEADRLEALLIAEQKLPPNPVIEAKVKVREYAPQAKDFSRRAQRAIDYARKAKTDLAYQLAAREIQQALEDEELAIVTFIAHYA